MYTPSSLQQKQIPATERLVMRLTLNLVDVWASEGLTFPDMTYTDLFACILPGYSMCGAQTKAIGKALQVIEDVHGIQIETMFPLFPASRQKGTWHTNQAA